MNSNRMIDPIATGAHIKELIKAKGLTVKDIQEELGLGCVQSVYAWLSENKKSMPSIDNLVLLKDVLELDSIEELLIFME